MLAAGQGRAQKQVENVMAHTETLPVQRLLSHRGAWVGSSLKKWKQDG